MKHYDYFWVHFSSCPYRLKSSAGSASATRCIRFLMFPSEIRNSPTTCLDPPLTLGENSRGPGRCSCCTGAGAGSKPSARENVLVRAALTCWPGEEDHTVQLPQDQASVMGTLLMALCPLLLSHVRLRKARQWRLVCSSLTLS